MQFASLTTVCRANVPEQAHQASSGHGRSPVSTCSSEWHSPLPPRHRRLEAVRRDLENPALLDRSVAALAAR